MRHDTRGAGERAGQLGSRASRRDAFKAAAIAAAPLLLLHGVLAQSQAPALPAAAPRQEWRHTPAATRPILPRGGTSVSLDAKVGDFATGDLLIEGRKIAAVGAQLKPPPQAQVIEAANTIVIPGFVD